MTRRNGLLATVFAALAALLAAWLLTGGIDGHRGGLPGTDGPVARLPLFEEGPPLDRPGPPALAVPPPGAPSGYGLHGLVVDAAGVPVGGAEVAASADGHPRPARGESDAAGRFLLTGLPDGADLLVGARAPGFAPTMVGGIRTGGEEVRIILRPPLTLSGRVLSPDDQPRPGARVRVHIRFPGVGKPLGGMEVNADEDGKYFFAGLPAVEGTVEAVWKDASSGPKEFDLRGESPDLEVDILVDEGPALSGRVVDAAGNPVPEAKVAIQKPNGYWVWGKTREDGTFTISGLETAPHVVTASDRRSQFLETRLPDPVVPPRTGLELVLRPNPDAPGWFRFRCVDAGGAPVEDIVIEGRQLDGRGTSLGERGVDAEGYFRSADEPPGRYAFTIRCPLGMATTGEFTVEAGKTTDLGTLRLGPGVRLRLRVLAPDGKPLKDALVIAGETGVPEHPSRTEPERFDIPGLAPGSGRVLVIHGSFEKRELPWSAGPGETVDFGDVTLVPPKGSLRGSVRSATAGPVAGVTVKLHLADLKSARTPSRTAVTGPDGRFAIEGLPGGTWNTAVLLPARPDELDVQGQRSLQSFRSGPDVVLEPGGTVEVEIPW